MDEAVDPDFEESVAETSETKPTKKAAPAKKKAGKAAPTKSKAAPASKKANNEAVPAKKANKEAPAKEANNKADQPKKTTLDLVCEAIEVSGESRKGLSVQAIKKYIISKTEPVPANLNSRINKALSKGIETGRLERPAASKDATGATGSFRLAKVKPLKRTKPVAKKNKINSEHASDSEATEKPVKPRKRNLSDTYIAEMKKSLTSTPKPSIKTAPPLKAAKQTKNVPKIKKDTSDSKIVVKETKRKSIKSYSSDTEVDFKKVKTTKPSKAPLKKTPSDKATTAKAGSPSKESKAKVKKLYNDGKTKSGKKTKKQE